MTIDGLVPADRPRWTELWRAYLAFYDTELPDAQYNYTWTRLMDGRLLGLVARRDSVAVGLVHFLYHESGWTMTPVCYLQDLYTDAAARGGGVGQALIEAVAADARARGAPRLYWLTQDHNAVARSLYDRMARYSGFVRYEYSIT